jgi:hypothetical protein
LEELVLTLFVFEFHLLVSNGSERTAPDITGSEVLTSYFIMPTLADFSCCIWKVERATLTVFLFCLDFEFHLWKLGRALYSSKKEKFKKMWKTRL